MPPKGRQSGNPGGKGKGKDNASLEEAEKEGGAEERNTKERRISKKSKVSFPKLATSNDSLAPGDTETDHQEEEAEEEEEEEAEEEEEEMRRSVNLPLDLWLLVAENLDPLSLLYLARTTKTLYQALMSKQHSKSIWKRSASIFNLPSLHTDDLIGPALISCLYETTCHACGNDEAFEMSYTLFVRWHDKSYGDARRGRVAVSSDFVCQKKIFLAEHEILTKIPVIRQEVFNCVPVAFESGSLKYYDVARLREENLELLNAVPLGTQEAQHSAVLAFVNTKKEAVKAREEDGHKLATWWKESVANRRESIRVEVLARVGYDRGESVLAMFEQWRELIDRPHPLTPEERRLLFPAFDDAVNTIHSLKKGKKVKESHLAHRIALKSRFDHMVGNLALFPSFPIFTELPSVRRFWQIESRSTNYAKAWLRAVPSITADIEEARRWIKLILLRNSAVELARIGHPLSSDVIKSLNPPGSSSPPARFEGMSNSADSTGLRLDDPATITDYNLSQLLNAYSMQAFAFPKQQPGDYRDILWSRFETINHPAYQGPLFPQFSSYWYQVLVQVLKASNLKDRSGKSTAKHLEALGPNFFCGLCPKGRISDGDGFLASELLEHLQRCHPAKPTDTPQRSLVLYNKPLPAVEVDKAVPAVEETARGRRAAARRL